METFGVCESRKKVPLDVVESRRRRQRRKTSDSEKESINVLQNDLKSRLPSLSKAESLRRNRGKRNEGSFFYKNPYKFAKTLFSNEHSKRD